MTDHDDPSRTTGDAAGQPDEEATTETGSAAERMLGQLQAMIDSIATQAAPVARQLGAKAAELAAAAGERAGPLAQKAADATAGAGVRLAERSREWAAELRRDTEDQGNGSAGATDGSEAGGAVIDGIDDVVEQAAKDDPAEGSRDSA